ncbi:hypothetical protein LSUE1_G010226 [Lachnellula suecica]|uniref:YjgF-like protein n=1 Tax=Lachnellula suecica TaxID=602035 RepID=A0A8T9BSB9_9HELO|nr:hypothetical protein LSUE1_G010226 [Lachnellula suecica]
MSSLPYTNDPGPGQARSDASHYSQAVRIGSTIKTAGQGGRNAATGILDPSDLHSQIDNAFENIDRVLQAAGLRGWEDVYLWRSFAVRMQESHEYLVRKIRERVPGHRPVWTAVQVPGLAKKEMLIEIEVEAYVPEK